MAGARKVRVTLQRTLDLGLRSLTPGLAVSNAFMRDDKEEGMNGSGG